MWPWVLCLGYRGRWIGGRLLGGFIHPPLHWRYAFVTASLLVVAPPWPRCGGCRREARAEREPRPMVSWRFCRSRTAPVVSSGLGDFSSFRRFSITCRFISIGAVQRLHRVITLMYLAYVVGISSPVAASSATASATGYHGAGVVGLCPGILLSSSLDLRHRGGPGAGLRRFFSIHAAAAGSLNVT